MSTLVFDGNTHELTLFDADGEEVDSWDANNALAYESTFRFIPNGEYEIIDKKRPHTHGGAAGGDSLNGSFGRFGIIRLEPFQANGKKHEGVGVHAGRADKGGHNYVTHGCIRTTDEAMEEIVEHMKTDPLESITVQNNHEQRNKQPHHKKGDHHDSKPTQPPAKPVMI